MLHIISGHVDPVAPVFFHDTHVKLWSQVGAGSLVFFMEFWNENKEIYMSKQDEYHFGNYGPLYTVLRKAATMLYNKGIYSKCEVKFLEECMYNPACSFAIYRQDMIGSKRIEQVCRFCPFKVKNLTSNRCMNGLFNNAIALVRRYMKYCAKHNIDGQAIVGNNVAPLYGLARDFAFLCRDIADFPLRDFMKDSNQFYGSFHNDNNEVEIY